MVDFWRERIQEHQELIRSLSEDHMLLNAIQDAADSIVQAYRAGCKLLLCGNGGSAADSQHLATELVSRFFLERKALDAEALTVNTSSLTAIGNDYDFNRVFSRQIEAKGKPGDVLIAISTSGSSGNIVAAINTAKAIGMKTIGFTGGNRSSLMWQISDHCIGVPSRTTPRIQEAHILIGHMLCEYVESILFGTPSR